MTNQAAQTMPASRRIARIALSLFIGAQSPVTAWLAGIDFSVRSGELAATYFIALYLAVVTYFFLGWSRNND